MNAHWDREEFLEGLALDLCLGHASEESLREGKAGQELARLEATLGDPAFQERRLQMSAWLEGTRKSLADFEGTQSEAAARVTGRIFDELSTPLRRRALGGQALGRQTLGQRTLAPVDAPGWRGDWALLRGFWNSRWAASPMLRIAAASLLVHLIALPALAAYLIWHEPEPVRITWSVGPPILPQTPEPVAPPEEPEVDSDLWSDLGLETDNARSVARYTLTHLPTLPAWGIRSDDFGLYWRVRLARLSGTPPELTLPPSTALGMWRVLALELALDQFVLQPDRSMVWSEWLEPVERWVRDGAPVAQRRLGLAALVRAQSYGLGRVKKDLFDAADAPFGNGALEPGPRVEAPLDADWIALMEAASMEAGWVDSGQAWTEGSTDLRAWLLAL
ncbi:MAG: hypothetical protein H6830_04110 [Planctomycetes bacterium]|nr:hypothetical protein [Planctomycetota bacterium]MCB9910422.1 hypothetical protein [Planctomycetota bacterium]HPF15128.1 hypothetical protein [Planctomycetota bacterium]HRV82658.1 hypothetical protein [Planctomycetota bacterium]